MSRKEKSKSNSGTKGKKYYQSNLVRAYGYKYWCSMGCREEWWEENKDTCLRAVGLRTEPVKLPMESAWSKNYTWNYSGDGNNSDRHYLENKLMGIRIPITEQQYDSLGWSNAECLALANTLQHKKSA